MPRASRSWRPPKRPPPPPPLRTLPFAAAAILGATVALFALQNGSPITLRFLVWAAHDVPLAGVVLLALAAGALIVGLPLFDQPMEAPRQAPAARGESADCGAGLEPMTEGRAHAPGP